MNKYIYTILIILLLPISGYSQLSDPILRNFFPSDFNQWTAQGVNQITAGTRTVIVDNATARPTAGSLGVFMPFTVGNQILVDQGSPNQEIVTILTTNCILNTSCSFTGVFTNPHIARYNLNSGTFGTQEAFNFALNPIGGSVTIPVGYPGTTNTFTHMYGGSTSVLILDRRAGINDNYSWDTGLDVYVVSSSGGGDVTVSGTPVNHECTYWTSASNITASAGCVFDGSGSLTIMSKIIVPTIGPTSGMQHTLPIVASDTIALLSASQTFTNKSISGATNSITGIPNASLNNSSITITPGTGISGGGVASLGGTITITNAGVTSLTATANQTTISASTGGITIGTVQNIGTANAVQHGSLGLGGAAGAASTLKFYGTSSGNILIQPASAAGTYTLTLPVNDGNADQMLTTDGNGVLTWTTPPGGGGGSITGTGVSGQCAYWNGTSAITSDSGCAYNGAGRLTVSSQLVSPTIGPNTTNQHTLPAVTSDTFALLAATQTLTNKTINASNNTLSNIPNASLTNSSITITAGTGMSGGGSTALGGTATLTNAGVLSITGTPNRVTVNASTGAITITGPQDMATSSSPQFAGQGIGGAAGTSLATKYYGSTSGYTELRATAIAGSAIFTLPSTTGTGAILGNTLGDFASTTSAQLASVISNETGSGSLVFSVAPTFGTNITLGAVSSFTGQALFKGITSGTITLTTADAAGTYTLKLPSTTGTNGQVLTTDGTGVTSWTSAGTGISGSIASTQVAYATSTNTIGGASGFTFGSSTLTLPGPLVANISGVFSAVKICADAANLSYGAITLNGLCNNSTMIGVVAGGSGDNNAYWSVPSGGEHWFVFGASSEVRMSAGGITAFKISENNTAGSGSPRVLNADDSGKVFNNTGVSAKNYYNLPSAVQGMNYSFCISDADGMQINAFSGDTIRVSGYITSSGGEIDSTDIGACIELQALDSSQWFARSITGSTGWHVGS